MTVQYWYLNSATASSTAPSANGNFYVSKLEGGKFVNYVTINGTNQKTDVTGLAAVQISGYVSGVSSLDTDTYTVKFTITYNYMHNNGTTDTTEDDYLVAGTGSVKYYGASGTAATDAEDADAFASLQNAVAAETAGVYTITLTSTAKNNFYFNVIIYVDGTDPISHNPATFKVDADLNLTSAFS